MMVFTKQELAQILDALAKKEKFKCLCHCDNCKQGLHELCVNDFHRATYLPILERNNLIKKVNKIIRECG